jgi:hypothetical protein
VLPGRGLCGELITRQEESYRLWRVVVCDLETSLMRRPRPTGGGGELLSQEKNFLKQHVSTRICDRQATKIIPVTVQCTFSNMYDFGDPKMNNPDRNMLP